MLKPLLKNKIILSVALAIAAVALFIPFHASGKGLGKAITAAVGSNVGKSVASGPAKPQTTQNVPNNPAPQPEKPVFKQLSSLRIPARTVTQFDFSTKKDPFRPFIEVKSPTAQATERRPSANALPIHSFDVSQFQLIGVVTGGQENKAMVVDPNKKGYVLKVGMTIGKNEGKVTAITQRGVEVLEQFRDDNGRVRKEQIKLTLPRKQ